jgi:predicted ATPase with chaperone activity
VEYHQLASKKPGEASQPIRDRISAARELQERRFGADGKVRCNARMNARQQKTLFALLKEKRGIAADGDDRVAPERPRLRSHPESFPDHRGSRR